MLLNYKGSWEVSGHTIIVFPDIISLEVVKGAIKCGHYLKAPRVNSLIG